VRVAPLGGAADSDRTSLRTGADGSFSAMLPAGRYRLRSSAPGFGTASIDVTLEEQAMDVELPLPATPALRGVVVDPSGRPAAGVAVSAVALQARAGSIGTITDRDGVFRLQGLPPGRQALFAAAEGRGYAVRAHQEAGDEVVLVLRPGASARVHVLDPGGEPLSGAVLAFTSVDGIPVAAEEPWPVTGGGWAAMELPAGAVALEAGTRDLVGHALVQARPGHSATVEIVLGPRPR
jgi:Carboxypeptidase regulatory-like domain